MIHLDIPYSPEAYLQETGRAGREQLLDFLGQEPASCSGCDVCAGRIMVEADEESRILDFVSRNRRRFTLHQAIQVLRGARSYEVVRRGLAVYFGFGLLSTWQEEEIEEALESLRRAGKIRVPKRGFWKDRLTL